MRYLLIILLAMSSLMANQATAQNPVEDQPVEIIDWNPPAERGPRFYSSYEYLLWWIKAAPVPAPLLTTSSDPVNNSRAILGQPTTTVLFGGRDYDYGPFSGGRLTVGWQLSDVVGIEGSGFLLEQRHREFATASDSVGNPVLATPFFDAVNNTEFSSFYSLPTPTGGRAAFVIDLSSRVWGAETNLTAQVIDNDAFRLKMLGGFRFLDVRERLSLRDVATFFAPTFIFDQAVFPAFSSFPAFNDFDTRNQFYGGQLGTQIDFRVGRFTLGALTKVALGSTHERLSITGATLSLPPGATVSALTVPGDAYALLSNIGVYTRNVFTVVPEVGLNLDVQVTQRVNLFVGYSLLYVSNVLRPGDQIDRRWNAALIPTFGIPPTGPAFPTALVQDSDLFLHGLNFGLGVKF